MKKIKILIINLFLLTSVSFAWSFSKNNQGTLTGYSLPINQDAYEQLNIDPNDKKQRLKSPNVMTDLFSAPSTNYNYDSNNRHKSTNNGAVGSKVGITIIYD